MLTGESANSIFEGLLVPVTISKVINGEKYICRSIGKCNWTGSIHKDNVDHKIEKLLSPGYVVNAKIIKIEYENLSVRLSATSESITEKEALDRIYPSYRPHFKIDIEKDVSLKMLND